MRFESTDEAEKILEKLYDLIMSLSEEEKRLDKELKVQEDITQDLLHEIELAKLSAIERMQVYNQLRKNRKERRKIKDNLNFIGTLKGFERKFIEKGMLAETNQVLKNIEMYKNNLETRTYTPKVLKNLKCTKLGG